jgi:hypothetical protein
LGGTAARHRGEMAVLVDFSIAHRHALVREGQARMVSTSVRLSSDLPGDEHLSAEPRDIARESD